MTTIVADNERISRRLAGEVGLRDGETPAVEFSLVAWGKAAYEDSVQDVADHLWNIVERECARSPAEKLIKYTAISYLIML